MKQTWKLLVAVLALGAADAFAEEAAKEAAPETPAEAKEEVKRPKKKFEYSNWDEAVAVATAWEQPIVAFVELGGDKVSAKIKGATFGKQELVRDFLYKNAVYYHMVVPAKKEKRSGNNNNQRQKRDKNVRPTPDMTAVRESERRSVSRLVGEPPYLPCIALAAPTGRVLAEGGISVDEDTQTPMASLMKSFKSAFESGKFNYVPSAKVEKLVAKELKAAEALAKRNRGKKE